MLHKILERAMNVGLAPENILFDALFVVVKGMQDKQQKSEAVRQISKWAYLPLVDCNVSNGCPKPLRV